MKRSQNDVLLIRALECNETGDILSVEDMKANGMKTQIQMAIPNGFYLYPENIQNMNDSQNPFLKDLKA